MWIKIRTALVDEDISYYSIFRCNGDGMTALREMFPIGEADQMNFVLFSTSGVHGSGVRIEDVEEDMQRDVPEGMQLTFLVIQPRIVCMRYGNLLPRSAEDIAFLKRLRASSLLEISGVGMPRGA